jgi:hypothetical protein
MYLNILGCFFPKVAALAPSLGLKSIIDIIDGMKRLLTALNRHWAIR